MQLEKLYGRKWRGKPPKHAHIQRQWVIMSDNSIKNERWTWKAYRNHCNQAHQCSVYFGASPFPWHWICSDSNIAIAKNKHINIYLPRNKNVAMFLKAVLNVKTRRFLAISIFLSYIFIWNWILYILLIPALNIESDNRFDHIFYPYFSLSGCILYIRTKSKNLK